MVNHKLLLRLFQRLLIEYGMLLSFINFLDTFFFQILYVDFLRRLQTNIRRRERSLNQPCSLWKLTICFLQLLTQLTTTQMTALFIQTSNYISYQLVIRWKTQPHRKHCPTKISESSFRDYEWLCARKLEVLLSRSWNAWI